MSWIKFWIVFTPIFLYVLWMAPGFKWKLVLSLGAAIGAFLAVNGKTMKGLTPVGRKYGGRGY